MKCSFLTKRIEELWGLSSPQCAVLMGDHIWRFVLVQLNIEGHFIQETVNLHQRELQQHSQRARASKKFINQVIASNRQVYLRHTTISF